MISNKAFGTSYVLATRFAFLLIAITTLLVLVGIINLRSQIDRERTRQASRECEILARISEDSLKSGDDLIITGFLFTMKQHGPAVNALVLDTDRTIRNSMEVRDMGRPYAGPCADEALKAGPGASPVACRHRDSANGTALRTFAKATVNPHTGAPSGVFVASYPEEWFYRGYLAASLPGVIAAVVLLALGFLGIVYSSNHSGSFTIHFPSRYKEGNNGR